MRHAGRTATAIGFLICTAFALRAGNEAASEEQPALSHRIVGETFTHTVERGESLTAIGARYGVAVNVLARENGISRDAILREGRQLRIDNRHIVPVAAGDGITINIPQRMLFYVREGRVVQSFPVGLGRPDWPTPTGPFKIISKEENPIWDVPKSIQEEMRREGRMVKQRVPPSTENPLGKHWLGLSIPGYGIHGTIAPSSVYQFRTHGCVRLHPDDMAELFAQAATGTPGLIVYQPLLVARLEGRVFLEAHRDIYRHKTNLLETLLAIVKIHGLDSALDWEAAKQIISQREGVAREVSQSPSIRPFP